MSANVSWYIQDRIILTTLEGVLLKEEIDPTNAAIDQYVRDGQAPVHLIINALKLDKFPLELKQFSGTRSYMREPNMGKVAVISKQSVVVRFFASVLTQAAHIEMKMFDTLDDGVTFLRRVDGTLKLP